MGASLTFEAEEEDGLSHLQSMVGVEGLHARRDFGTEFAQQWREGSWLVFSDEVEEI